MLNNSKINQIKFCQGGYNLSSISESVSSCVSVLLGNICPSLPPVSYYWKYTSNSQELKY